MRDACCALGAMPKVLMAASECAPFSKTGGLADVIGALPKSLLNLGVETRVITPYHRVMKERFAGQVKHMFQFYVDLGWRHEYVGIERLELDGLVYYLIDNEHYFGDQIYRGGEAEGEQYAYFTRAVLEAMPQLDFTPDIVHCNDWHTAMIPMLAKTQYPGRIQERCRYLLSIHNIAFQGKYSFGFVQDLLSIDERYYNPDCLELDGCADFLKAGCVFADRISTVSPSYAQEIRTAEYAEGLADILNARASQTCGIINGIDLTIFTPEKDPFIPASFSLDHTEGKILCKQRLQETMGLQIRSDVPIFAMVTRMTEQKGFELVQCMLDDFMQSEDVQFMLLGSGDEHFENFMRAAEGRYRGRLCAWLGYSEETAHLVYAGSDFFLMPSRFEPCGLGQMIAMRYGSIPIVRETGGLRDTVTPFQRFPESGNGFSFPNFDAWEMRDCIRLALSTYANPSTMKLLRENAMRADFGFERSARDYVRLYGDMINFVECESV